MGKSLFDEVIGDEEIDIDCPNCGQDFSVKLGQIGETVTCPHCGGKTKLVEDSNGLNEIAADMADLEKTLGEL